MADSWTNRLRSAWNTFRSRDQVPYEFGASYGIRPDRARLTLGNERSAIAALYMRLALDVATPDWKHIKTNQSGRFQSEIKSSLNNCLTLEANLDQNAIAFKIDVVLSMFDEGCIAIVPVDADIDPQKSKAFRIDTMRVGHIVSWYPRHVKVRVWDDRPEEGNFKEIIVPKATTVIIENPFYTVMNEPNSTLKRLIRKLNLLDTADEDAVSGKMDLIIQLPYVVKHETKEAQAEKRRKDIEMQLTTSQYGIAYIDGTERITQLNRPIDNNLLAKIQDLRGELYGQMGLTKEIFEGTADESAMLTYYNGTINPILNAITLELTRKFLSKTARMQGQQVTFFRDPFKFVTVKDMAEIADKFTRNKIATSNEIRSVIGWIPSDDPSADKLENSNLNQPASADKLENSNLNQPASAELMEQPMEGGDTSYAPEPESGIDFEATL